MTTAVTIFLRFADGGVGYLQNSDVATGTAGEEIKTSNATSLLNQVADVSGGQAFNNRVVTHLSMSVATQNATTASPIWGAIKDAQGKVIIPIEAGGATLGSMVPAYKPVRLTTGMTFWGAWQAQADSATLFGSLIVCTPSKCDYFFGQGSDAAAVELVNASGSSIGQAMQGTTATVMYGFYAGNPGLNNQGAGVSALWVTDAQGQMKALIPPNGGSTYETSSLPQKVLYPVRFTQNDKAYIATDT
jgi:hypothetical protein